MEKCDTSREAQAEYDRLWRGLTPQERFLKGLGLIALSRGFVLAGVRAQHPGFTPEEIKVALRRRLYGV